MSQGAGGAAGAASQGPGRRSQCRREASAGLEAGG